MMCEGKQIYDGIGYDSEATMIGVPASEKITLNERQHFSVAN